jgi:hypothetical protein
MQFRNDRGDPTLAVIRCSALFLVLAVWGDAISKRATPQAQSAAFAVARASARKHLNSPTPIYGVVLDDLRRKGLYNRPTERHCPLQDGTGPRRFSASHHGGRDDCVAGVVRFELRNPSARHVFEITRHLASTRPKPASRDYSRSSCGVADTQLGPGFRRQTAAETFGASAMLGVALGLIDPSIS